MLAAVVVLGHATGQDLTSRITTMLEVHEYICKLSDEKAASSGSRRKNIFMSSWLTSQVKNESREACVLAMKPAILEEPSNLFVCPLDSFLLQGVPQRCVAFGILQIVKIYEIYEYINIMSLEVTCVLTLTTLLRGVNG